MTNTTFIFTRLGNADVFSVFAGDTFVGTVSSRANGWVMARPGTFRKVKSGNWPFTVATAEAAAQYLSNLAAEAAA